MRCWDEHKKPCPPPDDWTLYDVQPCLQIKGLWMMNKDVGLLIEMSDAQVGESSLMCPF